MTSSQAEFPDTTLSAQTLTEKATAARRGGRKARGRFVRNARLPK